MEESGRERVIVSYLEGYNRFDVDQMTANLAEDIIFENFTNGDLTLSLRGLQSFRAQAAQAVAYFSSRIQTPKSFTHRANDTEVELDYVAVLALDFPNGLKKGAEIRLQGKSVFTFSDGKIARLVDIS